MKTKHVWKFKKITCICLFIILFKTNVQITQFNNRKFVENSDNRKLYMQSMHILLLSYFEQKHFVMKVSNSLITLYPL